MYRYRNIISEKKNVLLLIVINAFTATPNKFTSMSLQLKETIISIKRNNPNWRVADQLAFNKHDRGVKLESTERQPQLRG